jgi:pimeloyl-ACP methyl ester carboxylesterase
MTDTSKHITLSNGHTIGYMIRGDINGIPLFYFHGWPSSRLSGAKLDVSAKQLGIQIIAVDRPGYGLSSVQKHRTLLDFPDDIAKLADALGHKKFYVLGVSGGDHMHLHVRIKFQKELFV